MEQTIGCVAAELVAGSTTNDPLRALHLTSSEVQTSSLEASLIGSTLMRRRLAEKRLLWCSPGPLESVAITGLIALVFCASDSVLGYESASQEESEVFA